MRFWPSLWHIGRCCGINRPYFTAVQRWDTIQRNLSKWQVLCQDHLTFYEYFLKDGIWWEQTFFFTWKLRFQCFFTYIIFTHWAYRWLTMGSKWKILQNCQYLSFWILSSVLGRSDLPSWVDNYTTERDTNSLFFSLFRLHPKHTMKNVRAQIGQTELFLWLMKDRPKLPRNAWHKHFTQSQEPLGTGWVKLEYLHSVEVPT